MCNRPHLTLTAPERCASGSAITSVGAGATRCSFAQGETKQIRRLPTVRTLRGAARSARVLSPQRLAERIRIRPSRWSKHGAIVLFHDGQHGSALIGCARPSWRRPSRPTCCPKPSTR